MFGTALNYCVLRILGVPADEPRMARARDFIYAHGRLPTRHGLGPLADTASRAR